jgi:hypothetical protein
MADPEALKKAQQVIIEALLPYKDRLPADDVVIALVRCARVLLRTKLTPEQQKAIMPACRAYLSGKISPDDREDQLIVLAS